LTDIWNEAGAEAHVDRLAGTLLRLVESQEQVATAHLLGNLEEQSVLEDMLEAQKPPVPAEGSGLHYLLSTPFRYPPLRWGSRFGSRFEPSLLYGSQAVRTMLAEAAFYRFVFWSGMVTPPPSGRLLTQHTSLAAEYRARAGLRLQHEAFAAWHHLLAHPSDYSATQQLGTRMRGAGIEAFEFQSARDPEGGINVALLTPKALASPRPTHIEPWLCETTGGEVRFSSTENTAVHAFPYTTFVVDGVLPSPAL
jgi:hypothetical protein